MTERNATVHAAAGLLLDVGLAERHHKLIVVLQALFDRLIGAVLPVEFQKSSWLAHRRLLLSVRPARERPAIV